jgi:transposase
MYVGVDVAKAALVGALRVQGQDTRLAPVPNDAAGFEALATQVEAVRVRHDATVIRLIAEPTGGYEARLIAWAHARGWQVVLVNTAQVRHWAKGLGQRAKTDVLDARLLAHYGAESRENKPLPLWQPLPALVSRLDALVARRREWEQMLQMEHNRQAIYAARPDLDAQVADSVSAIVVALTTSLATVQQAIDAVLAQRADYQEQLAHLDSLPGVGPKVVVPLFLLLVRWSILTGGKGTAKALTAFVGLDAQTRQSGQRTQHGGISKTGDPELRRLLFMAVMGGKHARGDNPLRDFYERLVARGKRKMVALVAAMRKLLVWAWAVFCSHRPFDPKKGAQRA